jgi:hypothetical protein
LVSGWPESKDGSGNFSSKNSIIATESEIINPSIDKHGTVAVGEKDP